jgi:hypothetical protein
MGLGPAPTRTVIGGKPVSTSTPSDGDVLVYDNGTGTWIFEAASGGVTGFTSADNTASPNNTVNVASLTANSASTNAGAALAPKGTGPLLAAIPDNTATGGNNRGANATDLQRTRAAANQVASGTGSVLIGTNNRVSANNGVAFGTGHACTTNDGAAALSGTTHTVTGTYGWVEGGSTCTGSGDYGSAKGRFATNRGSIGRHAWASGRFSADGDAQANFQVQRGSTSGNTATPISSSGFTPPFVSGGLSDTFEMQNNSAALIVAEVVARSSGGAAMAWRVTGMGVRGANAAATAVHDVVATELANTGTETWAVTLVENTTRGSIEVQVTGQAATSIKWVAKVWATEVVG